MVVDDTKALTIVSYPYFATSFFRILGVNPLATSLLIALNSEPVILPIFLKKDLWAILDRPLKYVVTPLTSTFEAPYPKIPATTPSPRAWHKSLFDFISPKMTEPTKFPAAPKIIAFTRFPTPGIVIQDIAPLAPHANMEIASPLYHICPFHLLLITLATPETRAPMPAATAMVNNKPSPDSSLNIIGLLAQYTKPFNANIPDPTSIPPK